MEAEKAPDDVENPPNPTPQQSESSVETSGEQKRGETPQPASASSPGPGDADTDHDDSAVPLFTVAMDLVKRCLWKGQVGVRARAQFRLTKIEHCCDSGPRLYDKGENE